MKKSFIFSFILLGSLMLSCDNSSNENQTKKSDTSTLSQEEMEMYLAKGKTIAKEAFLTLSSNLKTKMKEGGVVNAVDYCNMAAYPLTDSIAKANNATLRRVSDKHRNSLNTPDEIEMGVIDGYKELMAADEKLKPVIIKEDGNVRFMAPILLKPACLSCHGKPEKHISTSDLAFIRELYPNDEAINFSTGDLRGIWSITFKE